MAVMKMVTTLIFLGISTVINAVPMVIWDFIADTGYLGEDAARVSSR